MSTATRKRKQDAITDEPDTLQALPSDASADEEEEYVETDLENLGSEGSILEDDISDVQDPSPSADEAVARPKRRKLEDAESSSEPAQDVEEEEENGHHHDHDEDEEEEEGEEEEEEDEEDDLEDLDDEEEPEEGEDEINEKDSAAVDPKSNGPSTIIKTTELVDDEDDQE